jgi:hypothetical protein
MTVTDPGTEYDVPVLPAGYWSKTDWILSNNTPLADAYWEFPGATEKAVTLVHSKKALFSIDVKEAGMLIVKRLLLPLYAYVTTEVTEPGMVKSASGLSIGY